MKTAKCIWMTTMMVAMVACGGVEIDGETDSETSHGVVGGPADSMTQRATRGGPAEAAADEDASDEGPAADATAGPASGSSGPAGTHDRPGEGDDSPGSDDAPGDTPADAECTPQECGPGLLAPNVACDDGSIGGPVCERGRDGTCGWDIRECPAECTADECGPQTLRAANIVCADGSIGGPVCGRNDTPMCGWYYRSCPEECPADKCGDEPDYLQICADGSELRPVCTTDADFDVATVSCSWKLPTCR